MISHPNLDLVHRFFQAYATNDQATIETILSPAIQWHIPGDHPLSGTKTGIAAVMAYFAQLGKAAFQASPIVMGVNDQYVIDCHQNWSSLDGVVNLKTMSCLLWKIEDGKITEVYNFPEDQHKVDTFFRRVYGIESQR
ncbi:nuclear transport factor 2 family protein [Spirosoma oryzicola]|uniref:nuclear transport factor 2 family protein n=1 Tax=Spirosoma oryzicola TaxID=2898794 RepID=UPI001E3E778C|nr:nuclear transport factor 2 family protein [Spirosoma oryzicola]UHG89582.1 nuclear transport factor 2 family protein [Spirosoma oryzicola]